MGPRPDFAERYAAHRLRQIEDSHLSATLIGLAVVPAFAALDWFTQREAFLELSVARFSLTLIFLAAYLLARRGIRPGGVTATAIALLVLSSVSITAMCVFTGGMASPYYAGVNLLVLTCLTFIPGTLRQTAYAMAAVVSVYVLGVTATEPTPTEDARAFVNNLLFMAGTGGIGFLSAVFHERLRREAFLRLLEAEDADSIRKAKDAAESALRFRDEFISIASHELKTPITSMKIQNDMLRRRLATEGPEAFADDPANAERIRQWTARNESQLHRLTRLIEDMLDISRINTGRLRFEFEPFDLAEAMREIGERFAGPLRLAGISVRVDAPEKLQVAGDRLRIEQVFSNLISNAIKYAPRVPLEISIAAQGRRAEIRFRDYGPGVPEDARERIFRKFERAHSAAGVTGLGLGLYISRQIVEGHGGAIWAEAASGGGSRFAISLPLDARAERGPTPRRRGPADPPGPDAP